MGRLDPPRHAADGKVFVADFGYRTAGIAAVDLAETAADFAETLAHGTETQLVETAAAVEAGYLGAAGIVAEIDAVAGLAGSEKKSD